MLTATLRAMNEYTYAGMMCRRCMPYLLAGLLGFLAPHVTDAMSEQTYELSLGREIKPFDEYLLSAISTRISIVSMPGPNGAVELQNDTVHAILSGNCAVQAVTEDGQEARKTVTIRNAQVRFQGKPEDIIPTGSVVQCDFSDAGYVYTVRGDTVPPQVSADLVGLIRSEGGRKSGRIMDPRKPVKIGDTWPINVSAFDSTLGDPPARGERVIHGTVTFQRIDTVAGKPTAVVLMEATVDNAFSDIEGTPANKATIEARLQMFVPLDSRYPASRVATNTKMSADLGEAGQLIHYVYIVNDDIEMLR